MSSIELLGPTEIRELAARAGIRPTKQLGQNFVLDGGTVRKIVRQADVAAGRPRGRGRARARLPDARAARGGRRRGRRRDRPRAGAAAAARPSSRTSRGCRSCAASDDEPVVLRDEDGRDRLTIVLSDALEVHALPGPAARRPRREPALQRLRARAADVPRAVRLARARARHGAGRGGRPARRAARAAAPTGCRPPRPPGTRRPAGRRRSDAPSSGRRPNVDSALVRFDRREPPDHRRASREAGVRGRRRRLRAAPQDAPVRAGRRSPGRRTRRSRRIEAAGVDPQARGEVIDIAAFARIAARLWPRRPGEPGRVEP